MSLTLHGETVQVTAIQCVPRGYFTEYLAYIHFLDDNGKPVSDHKPIKFAEPIAKVFRLAGYEQVEYKFSYQRIVMPYVDIILDGTGEHYAISHIASPNATLYEVAEHIPRRNHADDNEKYRGMTSFQIMATKAQEAREAKQQAEIEAEQAERSAQIIDHAIFASGEKLIRERLTQLRQEQTPAPTLDIFKLRNAHWMKGRAA